MKKLFLIIIILLLLIPSSIYANNQTVSVEVIHSTDGYEKNKSYPILFRLTVAKDWYIHAATKEDFLIPTELSFSESENIKINNILFPETEKKKLMILSKEWFRLKKR